MENGIVKKYNELHEEKENYRWKNHVLASTVLEMRACACNDCKEKYNDLEKNLSQKYGIDLNE